jgi:Protein of unknown function (DUF2568)
MPPAPELSRVTVLDGLVFLDELALLVVLAISGASIDAPVPVRVALAVVFVAAAGLVWGRWLAPRAAHPLSYPRNLVAKLLVFAVAAGAFAATGHGRAAAGFFVVSAALLVVAERARQRLGHGPR